MSAACAARVILARAFRACLDISFQGSAEAALPQLKGLQEARPKSRCGRRHSGCANGLPSVPTAALATSWGLLDKFCTECIGHPSSRRSKGACAASRGPHPGPEMLLLHIFCSQKAGFRPRPIQPVRYLSLETLATAASPCRQRPRASCCMTSRLPRRYNKKGLGRISQSSRLWWALQDLNL